MQTGEKTVGGRVTLFSCLERLQEIKMDTRDRYRFTYVSNIHEDGHVLKRVKETGLLINDSRQYSRLTLTEIFI